MSYLKQVHQKNKSDLVRVHELPNENKIYGKIANYSSVETSNYTNNSKISNSNSYQNYAQKNIFGAMQNLNKSTINNNSNKSNTEISNVNELSKKIELIKNQQKNVLINDINSTQETSERNRGINSAQKIEDTNMYQEIERQNEKERITTNLSSLIEKLSTTNEFTKKSETYASSDDEVEKKVYQIENINVNVENISEIEEIEQFLDSLKSYIGD